MNKNSVEKWVPVPLRIALGTVFVMHGMQKLFGMFNGPGLSGLTGFFAGLNIPFSHLVAPFIAGLEFFGGILIILGMLTRYISFLLAINMFVAFLLVHGRKGFFLPSGFEFIFVLFFIAVALTLTGAGRFSLERRLLGREW